MEHSANDFRQVSVIVDFSAKTMEFVQGRPESIFGYTAAEISEDYFSGKHTISGALFDNRKTAIEFTCKNGSEIFVSASFSELQNGALLLCSFFDATPFNRLEIYDRASDTAVFRVSADDGVIELPNDVFYELTGYKRGSGFNLKNIISDKAYPNTIMLIKHSQESKQNNVTESELVTADGNVRPIFICCQGVSDNGKNYVCCSFTDNTAIYLYKRYLDEFRQEFATLSDTFPGGSFEMEMENDKVIYISKISDTEREDQGANLIEVDAKIRDAWKKQISLNYLKKEFTFECLFVRSNGKTATISFHIIQIRQHGNIRAFLCFYNENDEVRRNVLRFNAYRARLELLLEQTDDIVFGYDFDDDELSYMNAETVKNNAEKHCLIRDFSKNYSEIAEKYSIPIDVMSGFINKESLGKKEYPISVTANGITTQKWLLVKNKCIYDEQGILHSVVGTIRDITTEKNAVLEREKLTKLDNLTQVLNKRSFEDYIEPKCSGDVRNGRTGAYIIFRIINLSQINEGVGILFGDTVLRNLAEKLRTVYGSSTEIGRESGNSLAVYLGGGVDTEKIKNDAQRISDSFYSIFSYVNRESAPILKIGISFTGGDDSLNAQKLEMMANIALLNSKDEKERCVVFNFGKSGGEYSTLVHEVPVDVRPQIRMAMDPLTTEMCKMLISANDVDAAISSILALVGLEYGVSRAYMFEVMPQVNMLKNTYEWCADGVTPYKESYQYIKTNSIDEYFSLFANNMCLTSDYTVLERIFPGVAERLQGDSNAPSTTLLFSMIDGGKLHSIIGFDVYGREADWNEKNIQQLSMLSGFLGTQIIKLRTQEEKHREHQLFQAVIRHLNLFVYTVNPVNYELLYEGHVNEFISDCVGQKCYAAIKNRTQPCINCPILGLTASCDNYSMRSYDEETKSWTDVTAFRSKDFYGRESAVISCHNISSYNRFLTKTDELTDSPMFNSLPKRIEGLIAENPDKQYIMLFVNVKKLRMINEAYGFAAGNKILIAVSRAISDELMPYETYARISGDKFAVLCAKRDDRVLDKESIEQLRKNVYERLDNEVPIANINFNVGVYHVTGKSTVTEMLDKSCIASKAAASIGGGSNLLVYNDEISKREEFITYIESRMEYALLHDEFKLYLQPKFDLHTKQVAGAEALTRWIMQDGTVVMPGDFIPLFEENGFIKKMDFYIYEKVMQYLRKWLDRGIKPMLISINVSRIHIGSNEFADRLIELMRQYNIEPSMVELELTETMFVNSMDEMVKFIENLHRLGFIISIDDFGSGYSSLNLLKDIPIDVLKMDRSLFSDKDNPKEKPLLSGVVSIAKNMEMGTICEGVENEEQVKFLSSINCDLAQGFYFQKPISAEHFEELYIK